MNRINIQDQFLNQVRRDKIKVSLEFLTGSRLEGVKVISFDNFCLLVESREQGEELLLIYKHALAWIKPGEGGRRLRFSSGTEEFRNPPRLSGRPGREDPEKDS